VKIEKVFTNSEHAAFTSKVSLESMFHSSFTNGAHEKLSRHGAHGRGQPLALHRDRVRHGWNYKSRWSLVVGEKQIC
jgi:hypothetical protein